MLKRADRKLQGGGLPPVGRCGVENMKLGSFVYCPNYLPLKHILSVAHKPERLLFSF